MSICIDCRLGSAGEWHGYFQRQNGPRRTLRCVFFGCDWQPFETPHAVVREQYRRCRRCTRPAHLGHAEMFT
jgi:hypothetical protein